MLIQAGRIQRIVVLPSQSESAALHAPAALEERVDPILPWLCFTLVLFSELTGIDRLP
jgi:hypothetical protein